MKSTLSASGRTTIKVLLVASLLGGCSSTPEATEAEATASAAATATADVQAPPVDTAPAPTATQTAAAPAPEPAADLVVTPVKITLDPKTSIEIKADKGIYFGAKKIATFDKNTMKLEGMDQGMTVWKDGTIEMKPASPKKMKFNDKDEVEIEGGGKIAVDDKGKVTMVSATDKPMPKDFKAPVITGFKAEGRRATTMGVVLAMFTMTKETPAPPTSGAPKSSAAPVLSAAPAPKK